MARASRPLPPNRVLPAVWPNGDYSTARMGGPGRPRSVESCRPVSYSSLRPLLFRCDAERAHGLAIGALRLAQAVPGATGLLARRFAVADPALRQTLFGREIPNP